MYKFVCIVSMAFASMSLLLRSGTSRASKLLNSGHRFDTYWEYSRFLSELPVSLTE